MIRLPAFAQTIRFRLTVLYSTLLFVLAAMVIGGIYLALALNTQERPITKQYAKQFRVEPDGTRTYVGTVPVVAVREVEAAVNVKTLDTMRRYSAVTLGGLFVASLGIGWVLSGRALRPVRSIAATAREIQGGDLSRRIRMDGPKDELRELSDTIDQMLDRLDSAFESQRRLIDDASHELRSPLAVIRANLDAVISRPGTSEEERARAVAVLDRATTRMTRLVEDLLATARRNAPALRDADVDLAEVVREATEEYAALADDRDLVLRRSLGSGLSVIGDHDALRRAVGNLLSNAVRLSPRGADILVATGTSEGWIWIAVRDSGPGIPDGDQTHVFDRFWRAPERGPRRDRNAGLGLAIVRQIVESHGGRVGVFSHVGQGSTFVLWFPGTNESDHPPAVNPLPPDGWGG